MHYGITSYGVSSSGIQNQYVFYHPKNVQGNFNIDGTILHSGFELWFREKKSAWHMTFTQTWYHIQWVRIHKNQNFLTMAFWAIAILGFSPYTPIVDFKGLIPK